MTLPSPHSEKSPKSSEHSYSAGSVDENRNAAVVLVVESGVAPRRGGADVERRVAEPDRAVAGVLRRAVEGLEQDLPGRPAHRLDPAQELVDQLVRELGHEGVLPVVALLAVGRVEHVLLRDVRVRANAVVHEAGRLAQPAQPLRVGV